MDENVYPPTEEVLKTLSKEMLISVIVEMVNELNNEPQNHELRAIISVLTNNVKELTETLKNEKEQFTSLRKFIADYQIAFGSAAFKEDWDDPKMDVYDEF